MKKINFIKKLPLIISAGLLQITTNAIALDDQKFFLGAVNLKENPELMSSVNPEQDKKISTILNSTNKDESKKANSSDWKKTPAELINEETYQEAFKKAKKDVCLKEETTSNFINWTTNGCDNVMAKAIAVR